MKGIPEFFLSLKFSFDVPYKTENVEMNYHHFVEGFMYVLAWVHTPTFHSPCYISK